jgi:hypothetical protein
MWARFLVGCLVMLALGCNAKRQFVPVSGVVTLNGKLLAGAVVSFQPLEREKGSMAAPLGSTGRTNDKGEFALHAISGQEGALVGKHKVSITRVNPQIGQGDARPPRGGWRLQDAVPLRYNEKSELTCDVPPGGKNDVNYSLTSP